MSLALFVGRFFDCYLGEAWIGLIEAFWECQSNWRKVLGFDPGISTSDHCESEAFWILVDFGVYVNRVVTPSGVLLEFSTGSLLNWFQKLPVCAGNFSKSPAQLTKVLVLLVRDQAC